MTFSSAICRAPWGEVIVMIRRQKLGRQAYRDGEGGEHEGIQRTDGALLKMALAAKMRAPSPT